MKNLAPITDDTDVVTKKYVDEIVPTKTSELENDSGFIAPVSGVPFGFEATSLDGQALLRWETVDGATQYRIQRKTGDGAWSSISYPTTNSHTDTTVANGTAYSYRALAYVGGTYGAVSNVSSATPTAGSGKLITSTAQTIAGAKTHSDSVYANGATNSATQQARNIAAGTAAVTTALCPSGCVYFKYE